ncbi:hypothetical protein ABE073_00475 [Lederbergia citrisecunda]|uniref:hypothetical protein n=1 Tax=Lederbergia citrisecunda TaxID=2833583 RepID=UPI003D296A62
MEKYSYFKLKGIINNPLRIFFLCGSYFNHKDTSGDKRIILKNFIESVNPNNKCLILEENFLFSDSENKLNYTEINLKSLKSIEMLTSLMSERVIILHESLSTAAEIGLFSSEKVLNEKVLILVPDIFTSEEDLITGFMKLAYDNPHFTNDNLEVIRYFPGQFIHETSVNLQKPHFYFANNELGDNLKRQLKSLLPNKEKNLNIEYINRYNFNNQKISKFSIDKEYVSVTLNFDHLVMLLLSLFTVENIKSEIRTPPSNQNGSNIERRNRAIHKTVYILKENLIGFLNRSIISEFPGEKNKKIKIDFHYNGINLNQAISYFVYVLYATKMLKITNIQKIVITNEFSKISHSYSQLIITPKNDLLLEVFNS